MTSVHFDVEEGNAKIAQKNKNKSTGNIGSGRRVNFKNILNTNSFAFLNEGIQKEILDAISEGLPNGENIDMKLEEIRDEGDMHRDVFGDFGSGNLEFGEASAFRQELGQEFDHEQIREG